MNSHPPPGDPGHADIGGPAPGPRRRFRRTTALGAAIALVAVIAALVAAGRGGDPGHGATSRGVSVTAAPVRTVDFQGVPGQVSIVGAATSRIRLTGELDWTGHAPLVTTRFDRAAHVLSLSYLCAAASPCTGNYRLVVPRRTAIVLNQPAGHVVVSGLAGSLQITADSVDIEATGLRSPSLVATIVSGHLGATFAAAPRQVRITLTSAQATISLPASVAYAVSEQVTSGYIDVGIPQASNAPRTVTAQVSSGELALLPR